MTESTKESFYRAVLMAAGVSLLAWFRTNDEFRTVMAGLLAAVAVMGIEWGWWAKVGDRMPETAARLHGLVIWLLSWMPAMQVPLGTYDVVFGWDAHNPRRPIVGNLMRMKSFMIVAVNGGGKTSLAHAIIHDLIISHTPDQLGLVIIDPKGGEFDQGKDFDFYERLPFLLWPIASTPDDIKRSLTHLRALMNDRARLFAAMPKGRVCNDLERFNYINETENLGLPKLAPVLVMVDEVQLVVKKYKAGPLLEEIATTGRAYGVFVVPITQTPKVGNVNSDIQAQCYSRFVGKMADRSLYGQIAKVPKEVYESVTLRDHWFFARFEGGDWQTVIANLVPYEEIERAAAEVSSGYDVPPWPMEAVATAVAPAPQLRSDAPQLRSSTPQLLTHLPQRATDKVLDWRSLTAEQKDAQFYEYLSRHQVRPSVDDTLEAITWSRRTAETWLARYWPADSARPIRPQK